jgi:hypothetical protein
MKSALPIFSLLLTSISAFADSGPYIDESLLTEFTSEAGALNTLSVTDYAARILKKDPELQRAREKFRQIFESIGIGPIERKEAEEISRQSNPLQAPKFALLEQLTFERLAFEMHEGRKNPSVCTEVTKALQILFLISQSNDQALGIESKNCALFLNSILYGALANPKDACHSSVATHTLVLQRLIDRSGVKKMYFLNLSSGKNTSAPNLIAYSAGGPLRLHFYEPENEKPKTFESDSLSVWMPEAGSTEEFRAEWNGVSSKEQPGDSRQVEKLWLKRWVH